MTVSYANQSPSKVWKFWQNTKLAVISFCSNKAGSKSGALRKSTGLGAGILVAGGAVASFFSIVPLLPFAASAAALGGGFYFGRQAVQTFKSIKADSFGSDYIKGREQAWLNNKSQGGVLNRVKTAVLTFTNKTGRLIGFTALAAGAGLAIVGGLQLAGVITLAAVTTTMAATAVAIGIGAASALPSAVGISAAIGAAGLLFARKCKQNLNRLAGIAPREKEVAEKFLPETVRASLDTVTTIKPIFGGPAAKTPDTSTPAAIEPETPTAAPATRSDDQARRNMVRHGRR